MLRCRADRRNHEFEALLSSGALGSFDKDLRKTMASEFRKNTRDNKAKAIGFFNNWRGTNRKTPAIVGKFFRVQIGACQNSVNKCNKRAGVFRANTPDWKSSF